jgi:hypothetical protein
MAFSQVTANNGAAPLQGFVGAHVTFDFSQAQHWAFQLIANGAPGAPPGCCLALTVAWLHNWNRPGGNLVAFREWVAQGAGGANQVTQYTVAAFNNGPQWWTAFNNILPALGLQPATPNLQLGNTMNGVQIFVMRNTVEAMIAQHRCTMIIFGDGQNGHAIGVLRAQGSAFLFDPNHGEIFFRRIADLTQWLFIGGGLTVCAPAVGMNLRAWIWQMN